MRRNLVLALIGLILIGFAAIQIMLDYRTEIGKKTAEVTKAANYYIFIEIEDNILYLLQDGKCIKKYPISAGVSTLPSPVGLWKIVEKGDWGEGFGGRWMGLNVPWGKYGIHGTTFDEHIGSVASHGCIRMYNSDVKELYSIVPVGTAVVIKNGSFGAFGSGYKSIEPGDRGADVLAIQQRLKELGYFKGRASGIYEDDLKRALHNFQEKKGLKVQNTITKKDWLAMGFREFE